MWERCRGPPQTCFWGMCHVRHPPPHQAEGKTMAAFVCLPTFPSLGVGLILYQCRAETSADASHSSPCQLEMSLEWEKRSRGLWEAEQRQAGYHCLASPPLTTNTLCLLISCLIHSVSWYESIHLSEKDDFLYYSNKLPHDTLCHWICHICHETVRQKDKCTEHKKRDED